MRTIAWCLCLMPSLTALSAEPANWVRVTEQAAWKPRDSSGELVFNNRLWLFGGWYDSFSPPPRDVWSSADGKAWELVTADAPWKYSDLGMTAVFRDRMWFLGGWTNGRLPGHGATNECWSSTNGKEWTLATNAAWSPRLAAGVTVFQDRLWVIGGTENYYFGDERSAKNDVWSSADGKSWMQATANAPWSPRAYHQVVAHAGKLWVLGGGNYVPKYEARNDVWCSADGVHWDLVADHAAWSPRLWFSAVTHRDRMWVLGGWSNNPSRNWGDVWHSRDGKTWTPLKTDVVWKERHEHSAYVFQDAIWIAGGHAQPLSNEVWRLELPRDFANE